MFSAQQLQNFAGKKRITQETFDDAVRENIEEFDMEPDEAVASAIAEFETQGVDLSNIVTTANGGDLSEHPFGQTVTSLQSAVDSGDFQAAQTALDDMHLAVVSSSPSAEESRQMGAIALAADAVSVLIKAFKAATEQSPPAKSVELAALKALSVLLPLSSDLRKSFRDASGTEAIAGILTGSNNGESLDADLVASCLQTVAVSTTKDEAGKAAAMENNLGTAVLSLLQRYGDSEEVLVAASGLLTSLTSADDDSLPSSRAFPNARLLAKEGAATALASALQSRATCSISGPNRDAIIALTTALRSVAANDEICQEAATAGAVSLGLKLASAALEIGDVIVIRSVLGLLRQLASSDAVKSEIAENDGLEMIKNALLFAADGPISSVAEQALGLLTNLALRNPEVSVQAVTGGCVGEGLRAMRALLESSGKNDRTAYALKQGCMALRNIAARCPEERADLLALGADKVVRDARNAFPEACQDVGSAALRDFGLDNYKD